MKKARLIGLIFIVLLGAFALVFSGCGGGGGGVTGGGGGTGGGGTGGGGGTPPPSGTPSAGIGAKVSDMATKVANFGLSRLIGSQAPSFKKMSTKEAVAAFYNALSKHSQRLASLKAKGLKAPVTYQCSGGGTLTEEVSQSSYTITYNHCYELYIHYKEYMHGRESVSLKMNQLSFSFTMSGPDGTGKFVRREYSLSDNKLYADEAMFASMSASFTTGSVGSCTNLNSAQITITMEGSFKHDDNVDGAWDEDFDVSLNNFKEDLTVTAYNQSCNEPEAGTISLSGSASYTDRIDTNESGSFSIPATNPLTLTFQSVSGGDNVTINGTLTYNDACFNGQITLQTIETLFFPDNGDCPAAGRIKITGDINGTIIYTSTGRVEVDEGSDGTVDRTYPNCSAAEACIS